MTPENRAATLSEKVPAHKEIKRRPSAYDFLLRKIPLVRRSGPNSIAHGPINEANALKSAPIAETTLSHELTAGSAKTFLPRGLARHVYPLLAELWQLIDASVVAGVLYTLVQATGDRFSDKYLILTLVTTMLMLTVYSWSDLFYRLRTRSLAQEAKRLLQGWAIVVGILLSLHYVLEIRGIYPQRMMLIWVLASYLAQLLIHFVVRRSLHTLRAHGYNVCHAVIVGYGRSAENFARFIQQNPWLGIVIEGHVAEPHWHSERSAEMSYDIGTRHAHSKDSTVGTGILTKTDACANSSSNTTRKQLPYLGGLNRINSLVNDLSLNEVYVTLPLERSADAESVMRELIDVPVNVNWIPDLSLTHALSTRTDNFLGHAVVLLSDSRIDRHGQLFKRVEDLILSLFLILLTAPILLVLALFVKFSSPGPVLFKQRRRGLGGRDIAVWKFRTMRLDKNGEMARQATSNDSRITSVGKWLRRSSLDELPQLFNVLQGRMSLIGPRPHPIWLDDKFGKILDAYMQRHRVKPGLTGWAQVRGFRGETDTDDKMKQRLHHDLYYITHWSPWLDIKILALTIPAILKGTNAY